MFAFAFFYVVWINLKHDLAFLAFQVFGVFVHLVCWHNSFHSLTIGSKVL